MSEPREPNWFERCWMYLWVLWKIRPKVSIHFDSRKSRREMFKRMAMLRFRKQARTKE